MNLEFHSPCSLLRLIGLITALTIFLDMQPQLSADPSALHLSRRGKSSRLPEYRITSNSTTHILLITDYIQEGISIDDYSTIMGDRIGRSTLFSIPPQQIWSYANSGDFAPTHYLHSNAPPYYYSFTNANIAKLYQQLNPEQQRFDTA